MKNTGAGRVQFADVTVVFIKYADLWCPRCRCLCTSSLTGWCLTIVDGNVTNQESDWLSKEKWACYTRSTHLRIIPCGPITCYFNTWKDHRCYGYQITRASVRVVSRKFAKIYLSEMVWYFIFVYTINRTFTWPLGYTKFLFSRWRMFLVRWAYEICDKCVMQMQCRSKGRGRGGRGGRAPPIFFPKK